MVEKKILLMGFQKFGPYEYNIAERIVERFNNKTIKINTSTTIKIIGLKLPIDFNKFRKILATTIKNTQPEIVIWLGMDFKDTSNLSLEVVAHALPEYGTKIKDKDGKIGKTIALDTLPKIIRIPNEKQVETAIAKIKEIKISENAGRHMCETVLRDSIRLSDHGKKFQPVFIHLPHTPELLVQSIKLEKHIHSMIEDEQKKIIKSVIKKISSLYL